MPDEPVVLHRAGGKPGGDHERIFERMIRKAESAWEREARCNTAFAGDRCRILKFDFREAAELISDNSLEFVFLDAAHSYRDTMEQILWYLPKVREGGLVTGHDDGFPRAGNEVVAQAVDAAARFFRGDLHVDKASYVWWWRKGG